MSRFGVLQTALAAVLIAGTGTARAEVQKFLNPCGANTGVQKLCPSFQLVLTPPDGWIVDAKASAENKLQIMVPKGTDFASAPALIYVQVFYHSDKQQSLADFARVSNQRWQATVKGAKISELPAVERANGKAGYLRFAFENPRQAQQAYEMGAFGIDTDKDGNEYILDVVMTGAEKSALDRAENDYVAFLKAN
jgi:hypothetical protein